jgi:hypothetical protein
MSFQRELVEGALTDYTLSHRSDRLTMQTMHDILAKYRAASQTEREKGTYFEEPIACT